MSMSSPGQPNWIPPLAFRGTGPPSSAFASISPASITHQLPSTSDRETSRYAPRDCLPNTDVKDASTPVDEDKRPETKKRRNKPTLSCHECVRRKTKCDRGRPHRHACGERQTKCQYAQLTNLLKETTRLTSTDRRITTATKKKESRITNIADRGMPSDLRASSHGADAPSIGLLSNVPYSLPSASNVFGIGSERPFANYWTREGGLHDAIPVLPGKTQADRLLSRYFECVDPVYPVIHRQRFYANYEYFWQLEAQGEASSTDPTFVALMFAMLALGAQFVTSTAPSQERKDAAELYASASSQSLRISSYLSSASLGSIQAMVLFVHFLVNNNHASDAWAFSGILVRQAQAMVYIAIQQSVCACCLLVSLLLLILVVSPHASLLEKQQRRKIWQAVLLQDTSLAVLFSLPPSATHTDVSVEDALDDSSSIAQIDPTDTAYIQGSWALANLVQETICSPRPLGMPVCTTARHKLKLIADFRAVHKSFPDVFKSLDPDNIEAMAKANKRVVFQSLFLTNNYFHNLMLVYAFDSPDAPANIHATLDAAHDAITAFFLFFTHFEIEARAWWELNHRAFLEALCIGPVLKKVNGVRLERAKADIKRMSQIMQGMEDIEVARERTRALSEFLE
ncbi:Sorbicillinoid biosynthetic cluster transcription factor 2 [Fusarium oxysporum f. sp. cubense]|uniref:Sorbicillinoid biosynthetic cluster transcription factor 2 n=1 Tax=Fusarium oxysporum f. sp. cubense TaxID=61366 RepID=A0A559LIA4_FUSOC|nr:Sorbicillinoid biosynthetic cluster transcription factor 2 [Fusarium oxysporum f. sp. cubense]